MELRGSSIIATVPVTNLEEARRFYGDTLKLQQCDMETARGSLLYEAGNGTHLLVYERPTPPKSDATAFAFIVDNLESTMKMLKMRGIHFEEYDLPNVKTKQGIAETNGEKTAWFKDPAGNILGITQSEVGSRLASGECRLHEAG